MKIRSILLPALLLGLMFQTQAQRGIYKTKYEPLVDMKGHNRLSGFHFAPGLTYTLNRPVNPEEEITRVNDQVYTRVVDPKSRLGFYIEAGMFHLLPYNRIFPYFDWSIGWKNLAGAQVATTTVTSQSTQSVLASSESSGNFRHHYLLANANLNSIKQIGHYSFIQNSIGVNFDYGIIQRQDAGLAGGNQYDPSKFYLQLHYKLGFGFKINKYWFIIPTLETPILNVLPFESGRSTIGVMNARHRPLILTIRLARLRDPSSYSCPPVYGPEGDKQRQQNYQMNK